MYLAGHTGKQAAADTLSKEFAWPRRQFAAVDSILNAVLISLSVNVFVKPDLSVKFQCPRDRCFRLRCGLPFFCPKVIYNRCNQLTISFPRSDRRRDIPSYTPYVNYVVIEHQKGIFLNHLSLEKNSAVLLVVVVVVIQLLRIVFWLNSRRFPGDASW